MMIAAVSDTVRASEKTVRVPAFSNRNAAPMTTIPQTTTCWGTRTGVGDRGSRFSSTVPRSGKLLPRRNRTAAMTSSGSASLTPLRKNSGNHSWPDQNCSRLCTAPSSRPAIVATMIDCNPPIRAAPRAATTRALSPIGVSDPCSGPTMIAANTAITEAITQFTAARNCGE